jgi:hypothetical protein
MINEYLYYFYVINDISICKNYHHSKLKYKLTLTNTKRAKISLRKIIIKMPKNLEGIIFLSYYLQGTIITPRKQCIIKYSLTNTKFFTRGEIRHQKSLKDLYFIHGIFAFFYIYIYIYIYI